jgi:hypothetical protein
MGTKYKLAGILEEDNRHDTRQENLLFTDSFFIDIPVIV